MFRSGESPEVISARNRQVKWQCLTGRGAEDKNQKGAAGHVGPDLLFNPREGLSQEASAFCSPRCAEARMDDKRCSCRLKIQGFCSLNSLPLKVKPLPTASTKSGC